MNRIRIYLFIILGLCFASCQPDQEKQKVISGLDSLNGALTVLNDLLVNYDSISVRKNLETYEAYRVFIKYSAEDTLDQEEAENIKRFFQSAKSLETFGTNKSLLTQRCFVLRSQIMNLKKDAQNNAQGTEQLKQYFQREAESGKEMNKLIFSERLALENALKEFAASKDRVEAYLRSKNEGKLPLMVHDNSSL